MFITHKGKVMKNKRNQKNIIWKILLIVFSIVLVICLIIIGIQKYQQKKQQEYYEALLENAGSQPQATEEVPEPEKEEAPDILKSLGIEIPEKDIDFAALQEENSDVYAWIYVPGTNVDYPVLQHPTDDAYYLEHNMDGSICSVDGQRTILVRVGLQSVASDIRVMMECFDRFRIIRMGV